MYASIIISRCAKEDHTGLVCHTTQAFIPVVLGTRMSGPGFTADMSPSHQHLIIYFLVVQQHIIGCLNRVNGLQKAAFARRP